MALFYLVHAFGYTPVFSNDVNLIFVKLDQAQELDMIIPSVDNFPGPYARKLHRGCSGRTWKVIDSDAMLKRATDPNVSHTQFADSLPDINLKIKDYQHKPSPTRPEWRIFEKE